MEPAILPVLSPEPHFVLKRRSALEFSGKILCHDFGILRMQHLLQTGVLPFLQSNAEIIQRRPIQVAARPVGPHFGDVQRRQVEKLPGFLFALADLLFRTLLVVDVGSRTDEFEDFSFFIAQDHGLLEMPAIGPVLSAERPGFHRETVS